MSDFQAPSLRILHPDTGFAFHLSDESFNRWWSATVLPEDSAEFCHLHRGSIEEARFVCAVDFLTTICKEKAGADTTLKAYCLAQNRALDMQDATLRTNAHYLAQGEAVAFLLDRVRSRSRRLAEERIASRAAAKIEALLDSAEDLETTKVALDAALKYMANQARERGQESERRQKKAVQDAMDTTRKTEYDYKRVPSLAEARLHIAMLVDAHGPDAVSQFVQEVAPIQGLNP